MGNYYNRDGSPTDVLTWAAMIEDGEARKVGLDERGDVRVSTVFLGLDHSFGEGPPLIYETMIFGGPHDEYQERYSTEAEAEEGHRRACELAFGQVPA